MLRGTWLPLCLSAIVGSWAPSAAAMPVRLLGAELQLPFDYRLVSTVQMRSAAYGLRAVERREIEVAGADGTTQRLLLLASYVAPTGLGAHAAETLVREQIDADRAKPGVRGTDAVQVDGFAFEFIDGPSGVSRWPQQMSFVGAINGARFEISVLARGTGELTPQLGAGLRAVKLDYAALLKLKGAFEEEGRMAVKGDSLDTPLSRIALERGVHARMTASLVKTVADGEPVYRARTFALYKEGFWARQSLAVMVGCGREDALDADDQYADFLHLSTERDEVDSDQRYTDIGARLPATLVGLPGERITARRKDPEGLLGNPVSRWSSHADGVLYRVGFERFNGAALENALVAPLASARAYCQLGLQFGAPAP